MEKKIALYVCSGCGIGDALDIEKLGEVETDDVSAEISKNHPNLCSQEGVGLIKKDIEDEGANTLVIAACSHRVMKTALWIASISGNRWPGARSRVKKTPR